MYSCANYPRGCRGRVNQKGAKCADCKTLNLRRPASASPFAQPRTFKRQLPSQLLSDSMPDMAELKL
ncbi:uncharacterized protein N7459_007965 [Penicillium hispanicum]|uniref:uncharacterized protein n=1 Tax=Penicillium hispanicum TaxID=1080232 RepID=UPI002540A3E6|nr:uncharacterized protein N7459_007965 [Penicillium hispanicum]KAJ5573538.1 hypothetical protein N7459_007965 [Penicillium hispanicum]